MREPIINKKTQDYLWKIAHNRVRCGKYFDKLPNWADKQYCSECGEIESTQHILLECERTGQKALWSHIEETWKKTSNESWIKPSMGIIIGIGTMKIIKEEKERHLQTKRYKMFVTEAIWTIWKKRNERIFEERQINTDEYIKAWNKEMSDRIRMDFNLLPQVGQNKISKLKRFEGLWCVNEWLASCSNGKLEVYLKENQATI
jgi:hypothetical protein